MKLDDLKKYHCTVRMITEGTANDYEDMDLVRLNYELKNVCKIITDIFILCIYNIFSYQH